MFKKGHKINVGRKYSKKTKEKMRKSKIGNKNPMFGKTVSKKIRKKISDTIKLYEFTEQHKENMGKSKQDEKHPNWKGDLAGVSSIHQWVVRKKGRPKYCEHCRKTNKKKYDWANIDHKYRRVLKDYIRLCRGCHIKYDIQFNDKNDNYND